MGSSPSQVVAWRHKLDLMFVITQGRMDALWDLRMADELLLPGPITGEAVIDKPEAFGGDDREGGVRGPIEVLTGAADQPENTYLRGVIGEEIPAWRRVGALIFKQTEVGLNPRLPAITMKPQRINYQVDLTPQWYPEKAIIPSTYTLEGETPESTPNAPAITQLPAFVAPLTTRNYYNFSGSGDARTDTLVIGGITMEPNADSFWIRLQAGVFSEWAAGVYFDASDLGGSGGSAFSVRFTFQLAKGASASITGMNWSVRYTTGSGYVAATGGSVNSSSFDWTDVDTGDVAIPAGATGVVLRISGNSDSAFRDIRFFSAFSLSPPNINPAHCLREAFVSPVWGGGTGSVGVNDVNLTEVADTLFTENFGLSIWHDPQTATTLDFVNIICEHIDASHYVDRDGLDNIRLIRDDYELSDVVTFGDNEILDIDPVWEKQHELPHKVIVKWWNPVKRKVGSISDANPANASGKAEKVENEYLGINSESLAGRVLQRDLRGISIPKIKGRAVLNRKASDLYPGDVISFTHARKNLAGEIMRVIDVEEYIGLENRVEVNFIQDVYALRNGSVVNPDEDFIESNLALPSPLRLLQEAPYYEIVQELGDSEARSFLSETPLAGFPHLSPGTPSGSHLGGRAWIDVDNGGNFIETDRVYFVPTGVITDSITSLPTEETFVISGVVDLSEINVGTLAQIDDEIVRVDAISATSITIKRGVLDTVPQNHDANSVVFFWGDQSAGLETQYSSGTEVDVRIVTQTGSDKLALSDAPEDSLIFASRAIRPYPAGAVQLEGSYEPDPIEDGDELTWTDRNRLEQTDGTLSGYIEDDYTLEAGTTYRVEMISLLADGSENGAAYKTFAGATSPQAITTSDVFTNLPVNTARLRLKVVSTRDTFDNFQSAFIDVNLPPLSPPTNLQAVET